MSKCQVYTARGIIRSVSREESHGPTFTKKVLVLDQSDPNDKYKDYLSLEFVNEDIKKLSGFNPGAEVEVSFRVKSRESKKVPGSFFTSCRAVEIGFVAGYSSASSGGDHSAEESSLEDFGSDIPF